MFSVAAAAALSFSFLFSWAHMIFGGTAKMKSRRKNIMGAVHEDFI
jgi:hypothetical protein